MENKIKALQAKLARPDLSKLQFYTDTTEREPLETDPVYLKSRTNIYRGKFNDISTFITLTRPRFTRNVDSFKIRVPVSSNGTTVNSMTFIFTETGPVTNIFRHTRTIPGNPPSEEVNWSVASVANGVGRGKGFNTPITARVYGLKYNDSTKSDYKLEFNGRDYGIKRVVGGDYLASGENDISIATISDHPQSSSAYLICQADGSNVSKTNLHTSSKLPLKLKVKNKINTTKKLPVMKVKLNRTPESWKPEGGVLWTDGNTQTYKATINIPEKKGRLKFTLQEVSHHKGYCSNAGDKVDNDLRFQPNQSGFKYNTDGSVETINEVNSATIIVQCKDYGAYGRIKAEAISIAGKHANVVATIKESDGDIHEYATIPRDEDDDKMADSWEKIYIANSKELNKIEDLTPGFDRDYAYGNAKKNLHGKRFGDALRAFDEYRGFITLKNDKKKFARSSPIVKELFIWNPLYYPISGQKRISVSPKVFKDLGYQLQFVKNRNFLGVDRRIAFNGMSPQKCIVISGDYTTLTNDLGLNRGVKSLGTPMTSGQILLYLNPRNPLFKRNDIFKTNTVAHEVGHSCWLWHHFFVGPPLNDGEPRCTMRKMYSGIGLEPFSSRWRSNFCNKYCRKSTKIK